MGSPLSPILANIFNEEFERHALKALRSPHFWKRYVDGTFTIIRSRNLSPFRNHLNSLHPRVIRFTHEVKEKN